MPPRRVRATILLATLVMALALAPGSPSPSPAAAQVAAPSTLSAGTPTARPGSARTATPLATPTVTLTPGPVASAPPAPVSSVSDAELDRQRPGPDVSPIPVRPPLPPTGLQPDVAVATRHDVSPRLESLRPPGQPA